MIQVAGADLVDSGQYVATCRLMIDVLVNGTTRFASPVNLTSATAAYDIVSTSTFSNASLVLDDVVEIDIDATEGTGTLAKGVFGKVKIHEAGQ